MSDVKRDLPQLTKDQAIVLSVVTGHVLIQPFSLVIDDVEKRIGRRPWPHEFRSEEFLDEIKELYRPDFMRLVVQAPILLLPTQ